MNPLFRHRKFDLSGGCGTEIAVYESRMTIGLLDHLGRTLSDAQAPTPIGPDAVALARAILAAAGNTGHRVISTEELQRLVVHRAEQKGARSMRERAAEVSDAWSEGHGVADTSDYIGAAIRALPLLPEEPARTPLTADNDA
ncbi:hypothetical protein ACIRPH_30910 [Nocardiopsis sp. NPDC101807]|uniref:hypothetical protein n=1 Tax=Nocardiopsis sp. NPDC101807 TaxID=3364339 RepID=UPI00380AD094